MRPKRDAAMAERARQGNASVTVAPLEVNTGAQNRSAYSYGPQHPFYDPWAFGFYSSLGYRPYYSTIVGYPILIGRRGGRRRGR